MWNNLTVEPANAVALIETNLRGLVNLVLTEKRGAAWIDGIDSDTLDGLRRRQLEETKRRAPARVSASLLDYTHLYELLKIIRSNWDLFKAALGEKKDFDVLMGYVEDYRNAPAHSRSLLAYEAEHLSGIAGIVRNRVTVYRSEKGPSMEYYPVIEKVNDSFGNILEPSATGTNSLRTAIDLHVGDVVDFECVGWDPHGRKLHWSAITTASGAGPTAVEGSPATIRWEVSERDVAENAHAFIYMASESKFHREGDWDATAAFYYRVIPPHI